MTLRDHDPSKLYAHRILDEVRAGVPHTQREICWALAILGEPLIEVRP